MDGMMTKEEFAIITIRLLGILFVGGGMVLLFGNILETAWDFNPNYLGYYFTTQLLRPVLFVVAGAGLLGLSRKIGNRIGKC
jgi:hypothetical protein